MLYTKLKQIIINYNNQKYDFKGIIFLKIKKNDSQENRD